MRLAFVFLLTSGLGVSALLLNEVREPPTALVIKPSPTVIVATAAAPARSTWRGPSVFGILPTPAQLQPSEPLPPRITIAQAEPINGDLDDGPALLDDSPDDIDEDITLTTRIPREVYVDPEHEEVIDGRVIRISSELLVY